MREFSKIEKEIIEEIVEEFQKSGIQQLEACKIIRKTIKVEVIEWDNEKVRIFYEKEKNPNDNKLYFDFIRTILLLKYLEEEKMIYTSKPTRYDQEKVWFDPDIYEKRQGEKMNEYWRKNGCVKLFGQEYEAYGRGGHTITDLNLPELVEFLDKLNTAIVIPNFILEDLAKNKFKTPEQRRFEKELCLTRVIAIISAAALVINVLVSLFCTRVEIESSQFDQLNKSIQNISITIDSIQENRFINKNDTINVRIEKNIETDFHVEPNIQGEKKVNSSKIK